MNLYIDFAVDLSCIFKNYFLLLFAGGRLPILGREGREERKFLNMVCALHFIISS